ncbi:MAG: tetratricopeptide repeat protein [Butyricimonas faecihominis]
MRNRTVSIVCMLLCFLGISRVAFAQQEDNLLRREYQVAMEEHVQNMIAALSMYSSDIYYENENVLRTRRVKLIRVFFRSEQAKMYDFLKIGVETQDNYLDVMEFLRTIPVVLPRVTFNMSVEEISPYVRLASGEFKLPVKVAITFVDLNTNQERTMPSRVYNVYYWQSENGNFAVSSMDLLREQQQTVVRNEGNASEWIAQGDKYYNAKNYTSALTYYTQAAEAGNARAATMVGWIYKKGLGVTENAVEAVKWYRMAANGGNASGQVNLGDAYYSGEGVTKDYNEAFKWFMQAAQQGNSTGQSWLAIMYRYGFGVTKDETEAVKWYRKAADQGSDFGQYYLAEMYENGYGVEKNMTEARRWYQKAADQGYEKAIDKLKVLSGTSIGSTSGKTYKEYEKMADEFYGKKNYTEALKYYKLSAPGNDGVLNRLGYMYSEGVGVDANASEAVKWFRKSAEQGYMIGQYNMGLMYELGRGIGKDVNEAIRWYRKAADQGYQNAKDKLAKLSDAGTTLSKTEIKYYVDKADKYYKEKNFQEALKNYLIAANAGDDYAQNWVGWMYKNAEGVEQNYMESYKWNMKSAENGNGYAMNSLGIMCENGQGVEVNLPKAVEWYRKAANVGNSNGEYNLGRMYQDGRGVTKNIVLAKQWYEKAAAQNNSDAQNSLGIIYYDGEGVTKDYAKAMEWYRKAADQGNMYGEFNIGLLYEFGYGVTKNLDEAAKWYRRAANRGYDRAKTKLQELGR